MIRNDRDTFRRELVDATPNVVLSIRFHGAPRNAPSVPARGAGFFAFRTWGMTFVTVSPARPQTVPEHEAFIQARSKWDAGAGLSVAAGPNDEWPVVEDD